MDSKDRLAELVAGMTEAQTAPLVSIAQAYITAMREAEEKGRTDISDEVIKYLYKASPREKAPPREAAAPRSATAGWSGTHQQQNVQASPQPSQQQSAQSAIQPAAK